MKKTLVMVGSTALLLGAACRSYEGDAATQKIAGIVERNRGDVQKAQARGDLIKSRVQNAAPERAERIEGYLERRAAEPQRRLEAQQEKIADWREKGRELAGGPNSYDVTDVTAGMVIEGTVAKVRGEEVHIQANGGETFILQAATNSHVVADNREIAASSLPVGFPVKATYGSVEGSNYYYSVEALTDQ